VFRAPARRFAARHRGTNHVYEFEWRSPALGGELGACHALELPFVFDTLASCGGPDGLVGDAPPQALADRVHRLWVEFIKGRPLPWPEYRAATRRVRLLEAEATVMEPEMPAAKYLD
jgi:para-nitrobenzyl esterase